MNANFSRADFPLNFSPGNFGVTQAIDLIAYTLYEIQYSYFCVFIDIPIMVIRVSGSILFFLSIPQDSHA